MSFFEERLEKKIPELKAMSIQQRSSDIVEFDFCMKLIFPIRIILLKYKLI